MIRSFYINNPGFADNRPEAVLKALTYISDKNQMNNNMGSQS